MKESELDRLLLILLKTCALKSRPDTNSPDYKFLTEIKEDKETWLNALSYLQINRVDNFVYYAFKQNMIIDYLPKPVLRQMFDAYATTCIKNRNHVNKSNLILEKLNAENIVPAIWKGILLAQYYYPDIGTRSMSDIDFYVSAEHREKTLEILKNCGFKTFERLGSSEDYFNGIDEDGILIDVHFKAEFFEKFKKSEIYTELTSSAGHKYLTFEPNAFLALLVEHQRGHNLIDGMRFKYFFDLIYFYRKSYSQLNFDKVKDYLNTKELLNLLDRSNSFVKIIAPDLDLSLFEERSLSAKSASLGVSEVRRSSIFGKWGLSSRYKPWARLILTWLGLIKNKYRISPSMPDVLSYFLDRLKH